MTIVNHKMKGYRCAVCGFGPLITPMFLNGKILCTAHAAEALNALPPNGPKPARYEISE